MFMRNILPLLSAILLWSCGDSLPTEKPVEKGPLELTIDNEVYNFYPNAIHAKIDNENQMYVYITYARTPFMTYDLVFWFDNDHFSKVSLLRYKKDEKPYGTADFDPLKWFSVRNYKYNPVTRDLSFEYDGKLFESLSEVNTSSKSIALKGKVDLQGIQKEGSGTQNVARATFDSGNFSFYSIHREKMRNTQNDILTEHHYFTNNGYRLSFTLDPTVTNSFPPVPRRYSFDNNSNENKITFYQFTGEPRHTGGIGEFIIRTEDWKSYPCTGSFTVTEIFNVGSERVTKGTFAMEVYNGNEIIHKIDNGNFLIK